MKGWRQTFKVFIRINRVQLEKKKLVCAEGRATKVGPQERGGVTDENKKK